MSLHRLGISGRIARACQHSQVTPLLALVGLLAGLLVVVLTPKEEEPQIDVTMADVMVSFPGADVHQVNQLIAIPGEQILDEIEGVEHIYSVSRPGQAIITVQFEVGIPRQEALLRLYNQVYSHQDWFPPDLGASQPVVKPKSIDDVPIMALTLYDPSGRSSGEDLTRLAHRLEVELKRVPGTRDVYTIGGVPDRVDIRFDPARLSGYGLSLDAVQRAVQLANAAGSEARVVRDGVSIAVAPGEPLRSVQDVQRLVVAMHNGAAVHLEDLAEVVRGGTVPDQSVQLGFGPAGLGEPGQIYPAVTVALAKKPGENAVVIARAVEAQLALLRGRVLPDDIEVLVTRDYGKTAGAKSQQLIRDLILATFSVVLLVLAAMGWRQALIVGTSVIITLLVTLVFSWAWGFTLNRVSLFALIFAIGILVDDAIVIVENISRRFRADPDAGLADIVPMAVDEVGTPTIMASLTVMAALLPMAFVTGLMGPYMSPIPINASAGMVISQLVAFVLAPWLAVRLLRQPGAMQRVPEAMIGEGAARGVNQRVLAVFTAVLSPFIGPQPGRRWRLAAALGGVTLLAAALPVFMVVILKMLPFDDKSELQVVIDLPEHTPMEHTLRVLTELGAYLETVDEVTDWQAYAGTASPINFNGLVRQYYLRSDPWQGDLQINLVDRGRKRQSHDIALALRAPLTEIAQRHGAAIKVVEVPPGPPVLSPLVAEVYGPDAAQRQHLAEALLQQFGEVDGLVDVDSSLVAVSPQWQIVVDRQRAARLGVSQAQVIQALDLALGSRHIDHLHDPSAKVPIPIRLILEEGARAQPSALMALPLQSEHDGRLLRMADVASVVEGQWPGVIHHKNLLPVIYVTADMAGRTDSPLYGMFSAAAAVRRWDEPPKQYFIRQPAWPDRPALKWDGEWQITYETFRDMGIAYAVGVFAIFLLLVAQFRAYLMPLIIMAPIPLTLIGILPGHAVLGKEFTATSMIGMIALAGIIVRNSILLVVFIRQLLDEGQSLEDAVILAGAVRIKPIALTAISAMVGALFILRDPIFSGLSISLVFGLAVSTLLTVVVIPLLYYSFIGSGNTDPACGRQSSPPPVAG